VTSLRGKRVVVTGATGFIGSHLVQRLVREGAEVRAMAHYRGDPSLHNLEHLAADELGALEVRRGDLRDATFVRHAIEGRDVVFHLGALVSIPHSYASPGAFVATNVEGTLHVLDACRDAQTPVLVHTSTSEVYGTARTTPMDEAHPLQAQSPYAASKTGADQLVESYRRAFGLPAVTVRPFNTYGPRQSARAIIPTIMSQLTSGQSALRLGALTPVRDLTFVTDTVDGFIAAATTKEALGQVLNLGVGEGIAIGDLARRIMEIAGRRVPIETDAARLRPEESEVLALVSDNRRAGAVLGYAPKVSLDDGLAQTLAFVRAHAASFRPERHGV
jgi:NAD dependent epimerase/dehydratase